MSKLSKKMRIAVIAGGMSDERSVSLETGKMLHDTLIKGGYGNAVFVDAGFDLDLKLRELTPDVVVNGLHGKYGEDGTVQGLLEMMKIPYTNSGVCASAAGMNKIIARAVMKECGIKVSPGMSIVFEHDMEIPMKFPFVIKDPVNGSSRGVYIIKNKEIWKETVPQLKPGMVYLCEKFFKGREINVAVLLNEVLGDVEIIPANEFYDFESKYLSDKTKYIVDPDYSEKVSMEIWDAALKLHKAIGCKGVSRSDFIVNGDDYIMLEINTLPGMTSHSLVPMIAGKRGISYLNLIEKLMEEALLC
ncbi:MAG TPA: D-alanine--D-alanine ligase [bacterium]|nr:D-alanine--D-alanine ligase [bacterium]HPS28775.1 D-alanine--D-alanine ligase [bacterium]